MKKHYVLFFLALIAAFIPAAADTYVVDIDDVSRVELDIDGTPVTGLKNGSNSIDMGSAKYLRVTAKKKMCSKIAKQTKNGGNTPHFGLFMIISRFLRFENPIFWKNPKKSVA